MIITVTAETTSRTFPPGTVEGEFAFTLQRVIGEGTETVASGEYVAAVLKNQVSANAPFTIRSDVTFQVPVSLTVQM
jgi:hypothetical protein